MGELGGALGVAIMMNGYFHDVATAMPAASGAALHVMLKKHRGGDGEAAEYFNRVYKGMASFARFSLLWILIGGIPRTLFYRDYEWATAVSNGQSHALIVKHVIAFALVGAGISIWLRLTRRIKAL